jgi:hypothetical protein
VVANRIPAERADELLDLVDQLDVQEPSARRDEVAQVRARRSA